MGKSIEIFIIFVVVFFITLNVFAGEVDIAADSLEYVENCGRINAKGNVVLNWEEKKVYADYVEFVIDKKIMNAYGNVKVEENGSTMRADSVSYNYDDETGDIKETFAYSSTVFMRAKSMKRQGNDTFAMKNIKLSTCDYDDPHTYFRSKRGKLVLNKRVTIYNAVLYAGKIPIFYLPVVTKSLKNGKGFGANLKLEIKPGHTNSGGLFLKTAVSCSLSETLAVKGRYGYLGRRGHEGGLEASYLTNKTKADVYGAYTDDWIDQKEKWILRPSGFHRLNNLWTIRGGGEFQNTNGLHDYSVGGHTMPLDSEVEHLRSYASITRQGRRACLTASLGYDKDYDRAARVYRESSTKFPNVKLDFYSRKTFMGMYYRPYFECSHDYAQHLPGAKNYFYRDTILSQCTLTKDFKLSKRLALKPTLGAAGNGYNRDKRDDYKNDFFMQYGDELNLRFRAARWMDWNAKHTYQMRTKPSCLLDTDYSADDYGMEFHNVALRNTMCLGNRITVENKIKYSMLRTHSPKPNPLWLPLTTELTWTPKPFITVMAKESQLIEPCKFNAFHLDLKVGEPRKAYVNLTSIYQIYNDTDNAYKNNEIKNVFGFGVWLTPKWRLDYNIRTTLLVNFSDMRMNDQGFRLYRDSHCYNLGIRWRITNSAKSDQEFSLKFDLKTNMPFSGKAQDSFGYDDPDAIFYPWEDEDLTGTL